jgi:hypothetical protein
MTSTPRTTPDETGSTYPFAHTPSLRLSFWSLWREIWSDAHSRGAIDLTELIRYRSARHADCFT